MSHTPEATNARLQMVAPEDAIAGTIRLSDGCYRIRFEILRRGFSNDLGWWLEAPDGAVVARVDQHSGDLSRSKHVLILPGPGTLTIANGHFSPLDVQLRLAHGALPGNLAHRDVRRTGSECLQIRLRAGKLA